MATCEFCGKKFSCRQNLRTHTKTAKYCLVARGEIVGKKCEYCNTMLTQKASLQRHLKTCCEYKDHVINELKDKLQKITQETENKLKEKDQRILELEKQIERGKDGTKKSKVINNNNVYYVNQKLLMLPIDHIEPLTINLIKTKTKNYTYEMYRRNILGVVDFIRDLTTLELNDGIVEKNYACTDRSRYVFHRLTNEKVWRKDGGAMFINRILDALSPQVKIHSDYLCNEINKLGGHGPRTEKLCREQTELLPFYSGVIHDKGAERKVLFQKIRNRISDILGENSYDFGNNLLES